MHEKLKRVVELVKTKNKRVGLRLLYKEFNIPKDRRPACRDLWEMVKKDVGESDRLSDGLVASNEHGNALQNTKQV